VVQVPDLVKCGGDRAERIPNAHFIKVKSRPQPRIGADSQRVQLLRRSLRVIARLFLFFPVRRKDV